jgi:hypothetical protein
MWCIQLPFSCTWVSCGAIQLQYSRRLPNGTIQLPSDAHGSHLLHSASIHRQSPPIGQTTHSFIPRASTWHHMDRMQLMWIPRSSCGSHAAHVAPTQLMWLPYGTCGTIGSHLPYSSHTVHVAPRRQMVCAAAKWCVQLPYGAHCSHIAHMAPIWPSHATCSFHMVPSASHMAPSTSNVAHTAPTSTHSPICHILQLYDAILLTHGVSAPIWCMWLPYSTCGSNMVPSTAHGSHNLHTAPIRGPLPPIVHTWLPYGLHMVHVDPIWCMWLPYGACGSHAPYRSPKWYHLPLKWYRMAPVQCTWLP